MGCPNGMISWADVSAVDADAAKEFYCGLFGWEAEDHFEDGHRIYTMFSNPEYPNDLITDRRPVPFGPQER